MATLEEKIAALMNKDAAISAEELAEQVELDEAKTTVSKDGDVEVSTDDEEPDADDEGGEPDGDEDDEEENPKGKKTKLSQDPGQSDKVNPVEANESATPGQTKSLEIGGYDSSATKTGKIKAKLGGKDQKETLKNTATADKQDDAGDTAKIKKGSSQKDASGGKLSDGATGSTTDANQAKNNVTKNEHMDALFSGEELSEEFKTKAATIFEAAVTEAAQTQIDDLVEQYNAELAQIEEETSVMIDEAVEETMNEMVESVDDFLNVIVENWVSDNQVALEGGVKIELMNSFVDGMKNLFKEHYIEVPNEKLEIVEEQAQEIQSLADTAAELSEKNDALTTEVNQLKAELTFESVVVGLTDVQKDRLKTLASSVVFENQEDYAAKLKTLKESYFPNGRTVVQEETVETKSEDSSINRYVAAISQNIKF